MRCLGFDFEVSDGCRVKIDTHGKGIDDKNLITFILGSAFGVIGMQRGLVPIHGTAVASGDTSVIITGKAGAGKSAILSSLVMTGYKYLADDVSMVCSEGGIPYVIPSYPQRKITALTAAETGESLCGAALKVDDGRDKYAIKNVSEWLDKRLSLSCIVELLPVKRDDEPVFTPEIKGITGHASLGLLLRNRYRSQIATSIGMPPELMKQVLEITSSIRTYQLIRPISGYPVKETASMIIDRCF